MGSRALARALCVALLAPLQAARRTGLLGHTTVATALSLIPGRAGWMVRRVWYEGALEACGEDLLVDFGAVIRTTRARVGDRCYVGPWSWFGWVDLGDDFLCGSHVVLLSGRQQHHFDRLDLPIREQGGEHRCVTIGADVWVGSSVVIGEDVAAHSVVASGAVVTRRFEAYSVLAGVPARFARDRREIAPAPAG